MMQCPVGQEIVSVEGGVDTCARSPICVGNFSEGNCPADSVCGIVTTGVYGCIRVSTSYDDWMSRFQHALSQYQYQYPTPETTLSDNNDWAIVNTTTTTATTTRSNNVPTATLLGTWQALIVNQTNILRLIHSLNTVQWDETIANRVQEWANTCPGFQHSSLGWENLASAPTDTINPAWLWYQQEETMWDYDRNSCSTGNWADCGHFTNMMSPSTVLMGCGISLNCSDTDSYIWCNYDTPVSNPAIPRPSDPNAVTSYCTSQLLYGCSVVTTETTASQSPQRFRLLRSSMSNVSSGDILNLVVSVAGFATLALLMVLCVSRKSRSSSNYNNNNNNITPPSSP